MSCACVTRDCYASAHPLLIGTEQQAAVKMLTIARVPQTGVENSGNERNPERVRVPSRSNQALGKTRKKNRDAVKKKEKSAEAAAAIRFSRTATATATAAEATAAAGNSSGGSGGRRRRRRRTDGRRRNR